MKINLSSKFYSRNSIEQALREYSQVCDAKIISSLFEVEFEPKIKDLFVGKEFCNFVLGIEKGVKKF